MPTPPPHLTDMHGRPTNGPLAGRGLHVPPFGGQPYFDLDSGNFAYYDSENDQWCPMGITQVAGGVEALPAAAQVDGALAFDTVVQELTVIAAGGADRLAVDDEQSSSSTSSASSASSESSST